MSSHYIKELGKIDETIQRKIVEIINKYNSDLQQSQLYSSVDEKKFVDLEKRSSKYVAITKSELFEAVDKLVDKINQIDQFYEYILVKNDVTYIKYEQGDFFKQHEDYLSYTSNVIEEYTLIMCIDANCEGGRTIFTMNEHFKYASNETTSPMHVLLFRKDLIHEGEILLKGTKEIMTINLLAVPKKCEQMFVVEFNDTSKKYYISTNKILELCDNNRFKTFLNSTNNKNHDTSKKIVIYKEENCTYEQFEVIYKILSHCYITHEQLFNSNDLIKFYSLDIRNVLIGSKNTTKINKKITNTFSFNHPFIINETEQQTKCLIEYVKEMKLPYIPFKLVMVEGTLVYNYDSFELETDILKMTPAFMSISEYNNLVFKKTLFKSHKSNESLKKILMNENAKYDKLINTKGMKNSNKSYVQFDVGKESDEEEQNKQKDSDLYTIIITRDFFDFQEYVTYGAEICQPHMTNKQIIDNIFTSNCCPGFDTDEQDTDNPYFYPRDRHIKESYDFYNLDKENKMFLSGNQCEKAIKRILELNLEHRIKKKLNSIQFDLPQQKQEINHSFCNESVYGNCTIMFITGFIRMQ